MRPYIYLAPIALGLAISAAPAVAQPATYKLAFIDPLSGSFANVGEFMLAHVQFSVNDINANGGVLNGTKLELLQYDNKLSPQESLSALQSAIDNGAQVIVTGGSGSSVVSALVQAVAKWNQRNPGKELIVFNHSSIDPDLTGKNCNFWHFQTDPNAAMKMTAIAKYIQGKQEIRKMYLLNPDYTFGRQWAAYGRQMVGAARPDVEFVGEAYNPIGTVKNFSPYLAKIKQSGADSVISGNWGTDMSLMLKAGGDAGYNLRYFNNSAGAVPGIVTAVSQAKIGELTWVAEWHQGQADVPKVDALAKAFKAKTSRNLVAPRIDMVPRLVAAAITKAKSLDSLKVAHALEDLSYDSVVGPVRMRAEDHQLLVRQVVNMIAPVDGKLVKTGSEGTQYGFRTDAIYAGNELALPSECRMVRP